MSPSSATPLLSSSLVLFLLPLFSLFLFSTTQLNSDTAKDFKIVPNGNLKTYLNAFKVGKELIIMGGIDVPFAWEKTYSFLTIEGLTAAKAESGMLVPVQAPGQAIILLNIPKDGNAITINTPMPIGFYYMVMAIQL